MRCRRIDDDCGFDARPVDACVGRWITPRSATSSSERFPGPRARKHAKKKGDGAGGEDRTPDLRFTKPLHYRCATPAPATLKSRAVCCCSGSQRPDWPLNPRRRSARQSRRDDLASPLVVRAWRAGGVRPRRGRRRRRWRHSGCEWVRAGRAARWRRSARA
jgi:hypothetical protein